jgi:hypothetical protein
MVDHLIVVWAEFSTLSYVVLLLCMNHWACPHLELKPCQSLVLLANVLSVILHDVCTSVETLCSTQKDRQLQPAAGLAG